MLRWRIQALRRIVPQASAETLAMLDPARGRVLAPVRAEIFGSARFQQHGLSLAEAHLTSPRQPRSAAFFPRLRENMAVLCEAQHYIGLQERSGHHVSPAGEWLLDNFHLVQAQVREIHEGLPRSYFRHLPVLLGEHLAGLPRIYGVAWAAVAHSDSALAEPLLEDFLRAYQQARELSLGELWALPTSLRVVLVENLRRLAERVAAAKAARELANQWCDELALATAGDASPLFALMEERGVLPQFALQVMQRLHPEASSAAGHEARYSARAALALALPDPAAAQLQAQAEETADNLSVSNAINALRLLGDTDWRGLIARSSPLMQLMQSSPRFCAERDDTQDSSLHAIEALARRSGHSELSVARALMSLLRSAPERGTAASASASATPGPRAAPRRPPVGLDLLQSPSYWLRGAGCGVLRHALGLPFGHLPGWAWCRRVLLLPAYLGLLLLASLGLTLGFVLGLAEPGVTPALLALTALLALLPASEAVLALVNRLISELVPPHRLPRLAFTEGLPAEHRVLVVVPAMLAPGAPGLAQLQGLLRQLERHHLANPERHAQFALLSDFPDAAQRRGPDDAEMLTAALQGIRALEDKYREDPSSSAENGGETAPVRFLLLHRERRWSDSEQCWLGWERKRGKLEQLMALLVGSAGASTEPAFIDLGPCSRPSPGTPYVLTVDSDTGIPPGCLRELVAVAAHPLNRPQFDPVLRRIHAGYGILQPRLSTPLPGPESLTPFHWLFAGQCGIDPYSAASSEVYHDLFDEGTFTGKGLLHVAAMHALLAGRLPEGQVLSHDLLEGSILRCGGVSDVSLIEAAPQHPDVAAARLHRWTRGDWQLLPLLLRGRHYGISMLSRWKMLDNLRRSLVAPSAVLLLLLCLAWAPVSPWAALGLVLAALGAGPAVGAVAAFAPSRDDLALRHFYRQAGADVGRALGAMLWNLAQLLRQAVSLLQALGQALYRMTVSRRGLLQWTTAAASQAAAHHDLAGLWRRHRAISLSGLGLGTALAVLLLLRAAPLSQWLLGLGLAAMWAATPLAIWWGGRARAPVAALLDPQQRDYLLQLARDSWRLFEQHVGPDSHHLPPDNVQTQPQLMVAARTSPTNIGLYLLAVACARQFGWISLTELLARCEATLATLAGLERYRGHFLNWYDTGTLQVLAPAYVSTVDSGNLCGHLLTLAAACEEWAPRLLAQEEGGDVARLRALAAQCRRLAQEAQFGFLYDRRRRLLHIGFRPLEQQLDASYYDLLASEARLASLWAIAKGDVPVSHWAALGRPFFALGGGAGLRSWSGSMFEYLMPSLILFEPPGSALASATLAAVREQIAYAPDRARHFGLPRGSAPLPWGVSESAYAGVDHTLAYQYAPQGVPRLALRRTPPDELVVAPYASLLAALCLPLEALANLKLLERLQARGAMGFYEALDFSPERQEADAAIPAGGGLPHVRVSTFMAHHQGMSLLALANLLLQGAPQRWGMADPHLDAVSALLQERVPREISRPLAPPLWAGQGERRLSALGPTRELVPGEAGLPPTHLMSNGRYSVALRANGAGWSRFGAADVTRWRDDALRDAYGHFLYLRRRPGQAPVSLSQHPAPDPQAHYTASFHSDRVCLEAAWPEGGTGSADAADGPGLRSRCTVWVSPEDDIELRRIELWNDSEQVQELELISMFELSLAEARADEAHPAFAKLFVGAEWDAAARALYFARKPRLATEAGLHAVHFVVQADERLLELRPQVQRARWLGRMRSAACPLADFSPDPLDAPAAAAALAAGHSAHALATGLDPLAALSLRLSLPPRGLVQLTLGTAAAASRAELQTLVDRYAQPAMVERASLMSATFANIRRREMRIPGEELAAMQSLSTLLCLCLSRPIEAGAGGLATGCDRRVLWRLGLSGDKPLLVLSIASLHGLRMLRSLLQALRLWSWGGLACDLLVLNGEPRSYLMPLQQELMALRERYAGELAAALPQRACGLKIVYDDELSEAERAAATQLARAHLQADGRPLSHHVRELSAWHEAALDERQRGSGVLLQMPPYVQAGSAAAAAALRSGSFEADSAAFGFSVRGEQRPARPWINVLANAEFGAQISESGAGYSWAGNSRMQQLSPWSNDPVSDPAGERFFVQDLHSREVWNVAAGESSGEARYQVLHEPGRSRISQRRGELEISAHWCVDSGERLKQLRLVLHNHGTRSRRLRVVGLVDWQMGAQRSERLSVQCAQESLAAVPAGVAGSREGSGDAGAGAAAAEFLLATQLDAFAGFGGSSAFLLLRRSDRDAVPLEDWSCDRREFFDASGHAVLPDHMGQRAGAGLDPCAALSQSLSLAPGSSLECVFLLGQGDSPAAARALLRRALRPSAEAREAAALAHWQQLLSAVQLQTPDPLFDALVNRWLIYQTLACRMWARAGFYQAGGAYGFRDQLQDALALGLHAPELLREQLLRAAGRQFPEGDVQHWWHEPGGAGVRTRISDDLLWLPYAVARYLEQSGDLAVLDEPVAFLDAPALLPGAEDAYTTPLISTHRASLYEHGALTLDRSLAVGVHGLPLMGGGDWNDGMNRVGSEGRGESVWLGWFLCTVVASYAPLARGRGDDARAERWEEAARGWRSALQGAAWDGEWFVRAFFDDGSPLGASANVECRIDLIAQAWSVLSGVATPEQQRRAMVSAERLLIDDAAGLLRLLDPPLQHAQPEAGYIQAYPPGVRENGGQYSHAGVWTLMAQARLGHADAAYLSFCRLSPAHRSRELLQSEAYQLEPYVMAADVYTQPPYVGRGGWSWYTGSAAWMQRAALESIIGLQLRGRSLRLQPLLPGHWPSVSLSLRRAGWHHRFTVCAAWAAAEIAQALREGAKPLQPDQWLDLAAAGDASHHLLRLAPALRSLPSAEQAQESLVQLDGEPDFVPGDLQPLQGF